MARRYAAALGMLAFFVACIRGIVAGGTAESTLGFAIACLATFTILGGIAGMLAENTMTEALRNRLAAQVANQSAAPATNPGPKRLAT
ncbi:MAG TPA: hypothetical protein VGI75_07235 [Pirellulales bacterium]|jgi:hypothetical protein